MPERLMNALEVAQLVGKSKSQVNRDAAGDSPKLATEYAAPGENGARLFTREAVAVAYGVVRPLDASE